MYTIIRRCPPGPQGIVAFTEHDPVVARIFSALERPQSHTKDCFAAVGIILLEIYESVEAAKEAATLMLKTDAEHAGGAFYRELARALQEEEK